eukprot:scaffold65511_cov83-Cyclotella_meneghiniana.AAC.1
MKLPRISIPNPIKKKRELEEFQKELDRPIHAPRRCNCRGIPRIISVQTHRSQLLMKVIVAVLSMMILFPSHPDQLYLMLPNSIAQSERGGFENYLSFAA